MEDKLMYVYPGTKCTFTGDEDIALEAGYVKISPDNYSKLDSGEYIWNDKNDKLIVNPKYKEILAQKEKDDYNESIYNQIGSLKSQLASTDYKCLKFVDGELTPEEYSEVQTLRHDLRVKINELETKLK